MSSNKKNILLVWVVFLVATLVLFVTKPELLQDSFVYLSKQNPMYVYLLVFVLGIVRSFTLIPVTYLIILGLFFIPATPLYFIIISGVMISSAFVYYFFEYLHVDKLLNSKYHKQITTTKYYLSKYELPVIVFWSMNPFLPSDIICYVAGTLRVNFYKFLFGMLVGEGLACAVYIFGGKYILSSLFGINF